MTYKLNPIVSQFLSSIILRFDDSDIPGRYFENGAQLAEESFDKNYLLESVSAQNNQIILTVKENGLINSTGWVGKDNVSNTSFF